MRTLVFALLIGICAITLFSAPALAIDSPSRSNQFKEKTILFETYVLDTLANTEATSIVIDLSKFDLDWSLVASGGMPITYSWIPYTWAAAEGAGIDSCHVEISVSIDGTQYKVLKPAALTSGNFIEAYRIRSYDLGEYGRYLKFALTHADADSAYYARFSWGCPLNN